MLLLSGFNGTGSKDNARMAMVWVSALHFFQCWPLMPLILNHILIPEVALYFYM